MKAIKLAGLLGIVVVVLSFAGVGVKTVWQERIDLDYPNQLTAKSYQQLVETGDFNLIFFKRGCPMCQAGKQAVLKASQASPYPSVMVDVETHEGQVLVERYGVTKAASLVLSRGHQLQHYRYVIEDHDGKFMPNQEALNALTKGETYAKME
ncbi:hypothetical protein ScFU53_12650 [Streptococcus canis]|uniref:glutaredoxin family protein n=3 Tax=Streptococcus canis TaxID=1329 RepID=UPI000B8B2131|nr:glutaredoxin family protein [Streptococcus canis]QJD13071.1 hypothetical protein GE024_09680 [Streptococcus canis]QKG73370.1 glutaredoxin family protein [Streptococcus canis]QKG74476.1 glutaredoxin family protein [Streptococcus canis]VTR80744.1 thioredoxin/glutaredoxin [Streptococcus canis]GFE42887.1 hypothetical protein ScFU1_05680 [Streptococcus canis]